MDSMTTPILTVIVIVIFMVIVYLKYKEEE